MNYKIIILLLIGILSRQIGLSQDLPRKQKIIESISLTSWNSELNDSTGIRHLNHEEETILLQHHNSKNEIEWELIKTDSNQYQFSRYELLKTEIDPDGIMYLMERGYLIESDESYPVDSFISFNAESFEEILVIERKRGLVKHGDWFERTDLYNLCNGQFNYGVKDGKWFCQESGNNIYEPYEMVYENGLEVSRWSKNFLLNPNSDTLQKYLVGRWKRYSYKENAWHLDRNQGFVRMKFKADGEYNEWLSCGIRDYEPPKMIWYVTDENHLRIERETSYLEFRFKKFTLNEIILEKVEKSD